MLSDPMESPPCLSSRVALNVIAAARFFMEANYYHCTTKTIYPQYFPVLHYRTVFIFLLKTICEDDNLTIGDSESPYFELRSDDPICHSRLARSILILVPARIAPFLTAHPEHARIEHITKRRRLADQTRSHICKRLLSA